MPLSWDDKYISRIVRSCLSGDEHSCGILDFYVAFGVLEAGLARELNVAPEIQDVFDVDPDGTAASPSRFFLSNNLSGAELKSKVKLATEFRQALSKMVSVLDEEIKELSHTAGRAQ